MNLRNISDGNLLENTRSLAQKEREITLEVLHHLREVERRSLFASLSYSSLFEYAVKELKYSEGSAQRRISSMRLLKELPQLEEKLENGALSLSALSQAQVFFRQEKTQVVQKLEILKSLENKSAREVERNLVSRSTQPEKLIPEKLRPVSSTHTELKFLIEEELLNEIEELKALLSNKLPTASVKDVLAFAVKGMLKTMKPKAPKLPPTPAVLEKASELEHAKSAKRKATTTRYIPVEVKRQVWQRDQGQCDFKHNERRCCSKKHLEFDHIMPFALGGENTVENLRLRCRAHNQFTAVGVFGNEKMSQFVSRMR